MDWAGLLVGALLGMLGSLLFWWVQFRVFVPRLVFGEHISKLTDAEGPVYRFKVRNADRRRDVIDLSFDVRLFLGHGVIEYSEGLMTTLQSLDIATPSEHIMRIQPSASRVVRLDLRKEAFADTNPRFRKAAGIDGAAGDEVPLETLLSATSEAYLRVRVLAYDGFTGSRKLFESKKYVLADIKRGKFDGMDVQVVAPEPGPEGPASSADRTPASSA